MQIENERRTGNDFIASRHVAIITGMTSLQGDIIQLSSVGVSRPCKVKCNATEGILLTVPAPGVGS